MGDALRRRMLLKPFPPVVVPEVQPGHRSNCYARTSIDLETCGCAVYARLERRQSNGTRAVIAAALALSMGAEP